MSTNPELTPLNQPFPGADPILKRALSEILEKFFYHFEHEESSRSVMSQLLRLHETMLLSQAKEIGGYVYLHTQQLMQECADYANGHGKIEHIYKHLEKLRRDVRS